MKRIISLFNVCVITQVEPEILSGLFKWKCGITVLFLAGLCPKFSEPLWGDNSLQFDPARRLRLSFSDVEGLGSPSIDLTGVAEAWF